MMSALKLSRCIGWVKAPLTYLQGLVLSSFQKRSSRKYHEEVVMYLYLMVNSSNHYNNDVSSQHDAK